MGKQYVEERDTSMSLVFGLPYGSGVPTCTDCSKKLTSEERLLSAIFGESGRCTECFKLQRLTKCVECGKPIPRSKEIYYQERGPHHSVCLPGAEYELP